MLLERSRTLDVPVRPRPAVPAQRAARTNAADRSRRFGWAAIIGASLVLAALSLLLPSAPTYDPWAWIVWGREVAHLDLNTVAGPSWKPLPVVFTTVFSVFGSAAPDLWLVIARAGAIAGLATAFLLARRLGGGVAGGIAAAAGLAIAPWWLRNAALGNSEPLLVAIVLGAVERHLAGDRRAAFGLGVAAALLRPESWPFIALYGLWLLWRGGVDARWVIGAGAGVLALWTLPEWWGSGDPWRAAHRAQEPNANAATFADDPALQVLRDAADMLTLPVVLGLAAAVVMVVVRRSGPVVVLAAIAAAWIGIVALMTADGGFSGNQRYLIVPVALAIVLAGTGAGWLVQLALGERRGVLAIACVGLAAAFAGTSAGRLEPTLRSLDYQAELLDELPRVVDQAGGATALRRCGTPFTGPFLVPAVAWHLHVHTAAVELEPRTPAVVLRERTNASTRPVPPLRGVDRLPQARTLAVGRNWRIVAACRA